MKGIQNFLSLLLDGRNFVCEIFPGPLYVIRRETDRNIRNKIAFLEAPKTKKAKPP